MTGQSGPWRDVASPVNYLIIRIYLGTKARVPLLMRCGGTELAERFQQVKGLTCRLEDRIGELGVGDSNFTEQVQVGGHHDSGAKVNGRGETGFVGKVVGK